ncbi:MAG: HD domain-containing protein [Candidatus Yanofskyibacterium parasiticum]|jgi:uncharacterized protein|nr:MAG: HD domain-containing protein [Candidatus Yanofskybacteria bacterium]
MTLYELAQKELRGSHDYSHTLRMLQNGKELNSTHKGNWKVIEAAILLHEFKKNNPDSAKELLKGFTDEEIKNVIHCIKAHYCLKGDKPETIEAKIVQDCDTLDMLGAIGIARGFMAGGEKGLGLAEAKDEYKNKRLGLYDKLNLEESRRIADEKFKFTQLFFETIDREMA